MSAENIPKGLVDKHGNPIGTHAEKGDASKLVDAKGRSARESVKEKRKDKEQGAAFVEQEKAFKKLRAEVNKLDQKAAHLGETVSGIEKMFDEILDEDRNSSSFESKFDSIKAKIAELEKRIDEVHDKIETEAGGPILKTLKNGIETLRSKIEGMRKSKKKTEYEWILKSVEDALEKVDETGTYEVEDSDGNSQREGIPVEGLIQALNGIQKELGKKMDELNGLASQNKLLDYYRTQLLKNDGTVPPEFDTRKSETSKSDKELAQAWVESQADELNALSHVIQTLQDKSKAYYDIRPELAEVDGKTSDAQHWRTRLEAKYISLDHRASTADSDEQRLKEDFEQAAGVFKNRRELIVAREKQKEEEPEPERGWMVPVKEKEEEPEPERGWMVPVKEKEPVPPSQKVFVVDVSEIVKRLAWTQAEEKLNAYLNSWRTAQKPKQEQQESTGLFGRLWKKTKGAIESARHTVSDILTHPKEFVSSVFVRASESGYLRKFYKEALAEIESNQNLMAEINARIRKSESVDITAEAIDKHYQILDNIIEQYVEDIAREEEKGESVTDPAVNAEVAHLLYEFAAGRLTARGEVEAFVKDRIVPILKEKNYSFSSGGNESAEKEAGLMYASNLFDMAKGYKKYIESKIKELEAEYGPENKEFIERQVRGLLALDVQLGLKARDVRETKPQDVVTWTDKLIDQLQSTPVAGKTLASPLVMGAGAAAAAALGARGIARMGLKTVAAVPVVGAIVGGTIGAMRRGRDLQYDRGLQLRREALAQQPGGRNAEVVNEYNYGMLDASVVVSRLEALKVKEDVSPEEVRFVANLFARLEVERTADVDQFTSGRTEGNNLGTKISSMTELMKALRDVQAIHPDLMPSALVTMIQQEYNLLVENIKQLDDSFASFRRKEMVKAGAFGAVVGFAFGAVGEAVWHAGSNIAESATAKLGRWMTGGSSPSSTAVFHEVAYPGSTTKIQLPDTMEFGTSASGAVAIVEKGSGDVLFDNVALNLDGTLDSGTVAALEGQGWNVLPSTVEVPDTVFSGVTHDITIPGMSGMKVTLPDAVDLRMGPVGGYEIVDIASGDIYATGIEFIPGTNEFTPDTIQFLENLGWGVQTETNLSSLTLSNPDDILKYARTHLGGEPPTKRIWHGNKDPRSDQVTWTTNSYYDDKMVGGRSEGYPYEYNASASEVIASSKSARKGLGSAVIYGEQITGKLVDGKEFQFVIRDGGREFIADFPGIEQMIANGGKNIDGSFDHKFAQIAHLFRSGNIKDISEQFYLRVYIDDAHFSAGKAFKVPFSPDGNVHIDKASTLGKLLFESDGTLRLTTEVAMTDETKGVDHVFATRRGEGLSSFSTEEVVTTHTLDKVPVVGEEVRYGLEPKDDDWFVPFVVNPRKAMEASRRNIKTDGLRREQLAYVYASDGEVDLCKWRGRDQDYQYYSETLKERRDASFNEQEEIVSYIERMDPEHKAVVESVAADFGAMEEECRVSICIPAYKEGERIYDSLLTYVNQREFSLNSSADTDVIDPKLFEILIFDNHPEGVEKDNTEEEIKRFQRDYPNIRVKYSHKVFPQREPIGNLRKIVNDAALMRMQGKGTADHILVSHDADLYGHSDEYVDEVIRAFDKDEKLDAFAGYIDYEKEAFDQLPMLLASRRFRQYTDIYLRKHITKSPDLIGMNSGFRAGTYAAIGGYPPETTLAEDLQMGHIIRHARNYESGRIKYLSRARVSSDPRRGMVTMAEGRPLYDEYGDWRENEEIRDKTWQELLQGDTEWGQFSAERMATEVQKIFDIYSQWFPAAQLRDVFHKAARATGIELSFQGVGLGTIEVTNTAKLEEGMKQHRERSKNAMSVLSTQSN